MKFLRLFLIVVAVVFVFGSINYHCSGDRFDELHAPPYPTKTSTYRV